MKLLSPLARKWTPVVIWMGVIFLASTDFGSAEHTGSIVLWALRAISGGRLSLETMEQIHFLIRKSAHLTEYAIFGVLLWRALVTPEYPAARRPMWGSAAALLLAALYACTDEYHQSFVPARTSNIRDVVIDTLGAAAGIAVCWVLSARRFRRPAPPPDTA